MYLCIIYKINNLFKLLLNQIIIKYIINLFILYKNSCSVIIIYTKTNIKSTHYYYNYS